MFSSCHSVRYLKFGEKTAAALCNVFCYHWLDQEMSYKFASQVKVGILSVREE